MQSTLEVFQKNLLNWYHQHQRDLPWRKTKDPYAIWVSEVMLQQTQVDTVIPYYERFLSVFPTVHDLAQADEQLLLKQWEGLGYYRRARHLHTSAKEIVSTYAGKLPSTSSELKNLKGFGPYTSASVASIAFGEPIACVDGNVRRVVSRLYATNTKVDELASSLVETSDPSSFNQGMMELGALICKPLNPQCPSCPVKTSCNAYQNGTVTLYPAKKIKTEVKKIWAIAFMVSSHQKVFLRQRSAEEKWAGMWEFPLFEFEKPSSALLTQAKNKLNEDYGIKAVKTISLGMFQHILTHRKMNIELIQVSHWEGKFKGGQFYSAKTYKDMPLSKLQQKAMQKSELVTEPTLPF